MWMRPTYVLVGASLRAKDSAFIAVSRLEAAVAQLAQPLRLALRIGCRTLLRFLPIALYLALTRAARTKSKCARKPHSTHFTNGGALCSFAFFIVACSCSRS
jgi:hypothetical protein